LAGFNKAAKISCPDSFKGKCIISLIPTSELIVGQRWPRWFVIDAMPELTDTLCLQCGLCCNAKHKSVCRD